MQVTQILIALCALAAAVMAQPGAGNPQQEFCAKPARGCGTQQKENSCINWHGCAWSCTGGNARCVPNRVFNDGTTGPGCAVGSVCCTALSNEVCSTKPYRTPTMSPTPPTFSPTKSPVVVCRTPTAGCASTTNAQACNAFNGCRWNVAANVCQIGGCSGTPVPTASPTLCNDLPSTGCGAATTRDTCIEFDCCKWNILGRCVGKDAPDPPACSSLRGPQCKKRKDCRISKKKCITRGSG